MEASEKPQLPLEGPDEAKPSVRPLDDRLVIERLEVIDELAARVVRDQAVQKRPPAETVRKAIEIGTRIIDSESVTTNVDLVKRELHEGLGQLNRELESTLQDGGKSLSDAIADAFGADRSDSVQRQIKEIVDTASEQQRMGLMKLLTAEDGSNPLVAVQARLGKAMLEAEERHRQEVERLRESHTGEARALHKEVAGLRENLARLLEKQEGDSRVAEAEEAGTRKGRTFEEMVHAEIEAIAEARDDAAHHVGDTSSEAGGKMGDTLVELAAASGQTIATVVFEAKNRRLSKNEAWAELNGAMKERDAAYGVLVVAGDDKVPAGLEELTEYQGNKIIVVLDRDEPSYLALRLVYRYVRARVMAASRGGYEIDAPGIQAATEEAQSRLKGVNRIRKSLTSITTSADKAREEVDGMVGDVETCLARIESLIEVAGAEDGEA
jgi:hypothetical protein